MLHESCYRDEQVFQGPELYRDGFLHDTESFSQPDSRRIEGENNRI